MITFSVVSISNVLVSLQLRQLVCSMIFLVWGLVDQRCNELFRTSQNAFWGYNISLLRVNECYRRFQNPRKCLKWCEVWDSITDLKKYQIALYDNHLWKDCWKEMHLKSVMRKLNRLSIVVFWRAKAEKKEVGV